MPIISFMVLVIAALFFPLFGGAISADETEGVWALVDEEAGLPRPSVSGDFQSRSTVDLVADDVYEDFATARELLYARGRFPLSDDLSVTLSALGQHLFRVNSEGRENGARYRADLEELYADLHLGRLDLRLGRQIVSWGTTDVVNPTDTINSKEMSYLIDEELGHVKIPNLMAKADYYPGRFHLEAIFIPFFRPAKVDLVGGDWALLGNRVPVTELAGYLDESARGRLFLSYLNSVVPDWDEKLEETLSAERMDVLGPETPQDDLEHWEAAAKAGASFGPANMSLSYFYGFGDLPTLHFNPQWVAVFQALGNSSGAPDPAEMLRRARALEVKPLATMEFRRLHQIGADFSANLGPSVLRAEGSYVFPRALYNVDLEVVERPMLTYTVAADYTFPHGVVFNLQFLRSFTQYWREDILTDQAYTFLISYLHGTFVEDRLEIVLELLYNLSAWSTEGAGKGDLFGEDFQHSAKISYNFLPDFEAGLGVIVFGGPRDQILAFSHDKNFGFLDLKLSF